MGTFDVAFPAGKEVTFPSRCVACEKKDPDSVISISILGAKTEPLFFVAADALDGSGGAASNNTSNKINGIPACKGCVAGLKWYHRIYTFLLYTAWLPGVILIVMNIVPIWASVTFLLACVVCVPVLSMIFPPSFGGTFINNKANFEFRSRLVAEEFMRLNNLPAENK